MNFSELVTMSYRLLHIQSLPSPAEYPGLSKVSAFATVTSVSAAAVDAAQNVAAGVSSMPLSSWLAIGGAVTAVCGQVVQVLLKARSDKMEQDRAFARQIQSDRESDDENKAKRIGKLIQDLEYSNAKVARLTDELADTKQRLDQLRVRTVEVEAKTNAVTSQTNDQEMRIQEIEAVVPPSPSSTNLKSKK